MPATGICAILRACWWNDELGSSGCAVAGEGREWGCLEDLRLQHRNNAQSPDQAMTWLNFGQGRRGEVGPVFQRLAGRLLGQVCK